MRARHPDVEGFVERDGLRLGYEVFGAGEPTVLLLPTWSIFPSRFWKFQVPYLARHFRVITYDGPGSGRTGRTKDPSRYSLESYAADAVAVLDEVGAERVVAVGLSLGGAYAARLTALHPERVSGLVMVAPSIRVTEPPEDRVDSYEALFDPYPDDPDGWEKYNVHYWHHDYEDFIRFFVGRLFTERFSTKAFDDGVGWGLETTAGVLEAEARKPMPVSGSGILEGIVCPVLVIHGADDAIIGVETGEEVARITGGSLLRMEGSGHVPMVRDPVKVNLALFDFISRVAA